MLKLYVGELDKNNKNYCGFNDAWFDLNIDKIQFKGKVLEIIKKIDNVEYVGNKRVLSKFLKDTTISVRELSSGCKTVINITSFPDTVFSISECGNNALQVLFNLKQGKAYLSGFILPLPFNNDIEVIYKGKRNIVHNNIELEDFLYEIY